MMYTQLVLNVTLQADTPEDVIETIQYMTNNRARLPRYRRYHELYDTRKWNKCLMSDSEVFMGHNTTSFCRLHHAYSLSVNASCAVFDDEYQKFVDFIGPYISQCGFIGYIMFEEDEMPTMIFKDEDQRIRYQ